MSNRRNMRVNRNVTTILGDVEPLSYVSVYVYSHSDPKTVEFGFTVEVGQTTHKVEVKMTERAAKDLRDNLNREFPVC